MAYEIWDGFDNYDTAHDEWETVNGSPSYSTSYARFAAASGCVSKGVSMGLSTWKRKNLSGNRSGLILSFPFEISSLSFTGYEDFLGFLDNGTMQCMLGVSASGALAIRNGSAGVVQGATAPGVIASGNYYFIDLIITFGSTTGSATLYLSTPAGGAAILTLTNINTIANSNAYANQVEIGELRGNNLTLYFDDFHCHTNSGAAPNTVLGEGTRIYTKMPNGAGYATTLTPNGASANWQCVDDVPPDDDTTYVSAASFPLTEGYAVGAASFTGTVNGVVRKSRFRKDDGAAHTFQNGVRSSSTNSLATAVNVLSTYSWTDSFYALDPATSAAWTAAAADAAQPIISAAS
ncbi:MAG TPA: hypothetical protein VGM18_04855 [Candidatus Sulfotelmatobacter sp.]|jgi:hypothetical protein